MNEINIVDEVKKYYSEKVTKFGSTPKGVDWNGRESQFLRFKQLCKLMDNRNDCFHVNDFGCGYGALIDYLLEHFGGFRYTGFDVSEEMIEEAKNKYQNLENVDFLIGSEINAIADYSILSGVFNVRLKNSEEKWIEYVKAILDNLHENSRSGFGFNCLSLYSDVNLRRPDLYYADPCMFFDFCKKRYSKNVSILHDYDLYEFTILVRS